MICLGNVRLAESFFSFESFPLVYALRVWICKHIEAARDQKYIYKEFLNGRMPRGVHYPKELKSVT